MPTLAASFAAATPPSTRPLRRRVLTAHALSGLGDVALLGRSDRAFLGGLSSFFAAHVAYVVGFAGESRSLQDRSHRGGVASAATVFVTAGPGLSWAASRRRPGLELPVLAYAGVLTTMYAASTRLGDHLAPEIRHQIVTGTATFLASDAVIGLRKFVLHDPAPWTDGVVMLTYTLGQALIASGAARALASPVRTLPPDAASAAVEGSLPSRGRDT